MILKKIKPLYKLRNFILIIVLFTSFDNIYSQCAIPNVGCPNTNLANYGANSNTDATTLEYDNFVSSFHSTVARTGDGSFQLWGEKMANNGTSHLYSPTVFNSTNYDRERQNFNGYCQSPSSRN